MNLGDYFLRNFLGDGYSIFMRIWEKTEPAPFEPKIYKPSIEKDNDKLIIVKASHQQIALALAEFIDKYNEREYVCLPRVYVLSENKYAITFPYDVMFDVFCYLVNFLYNYPETGDKLTIIAWATADDEYYSKEEYENRCCMFYIPADEQGHDTIYLTSEDNACYKIKFSENEVQRLSNTKMYFDKPSYTLKQLEAYQCIDVV